MVVLGDWVLAEVVPLHAVNAQLAVSWRYCQVTIIVLPKTYEDYSDIQNKNLCAIEFSICVKKKNEDIQNKNDTKVPTWIIHAQST
jgi:hypothetical protein